MTKVLITPSTLKGADGPHLDVLRAAGLEWGFPPRPIHSSGEELIPLLSEVAAIIAGSEPYTRKLMEAGPGLRVIARAGVGYDAVDVAAATERGIAVTITPGANQDAVAEHTFAMLLAAAKKLIPQHVAVKEGQWPRQATLPLRGQTLGIAGLGRIGKAVAVRAAAFDMRLLAYEPYPDAAFVKRLGVALVSWDTLLKDSDFLTLHIPLSPETRHVINRSSLGKMKPTSFLINTARGGLVCQADLLEAVQKRQIAGAALDVFEHEPPGKIPLVELDNLVLTAHTAGVDTQSLSDMAVSAARAIAALSKSEWPAEQVVNPEVRGKFCW